MPNDLTTLTQTSVFNIDNVLAEIATRGFLRPTRFLVSIIMTPAMLGLTGLAASSKTWHTLTAQTRQGTAMSFWAEQAELPGVMLDVNLFRRYGYGPLEPKAYNAHFADIPVMFRADAQGMVHSFLHSWARMVVDYRYDFDMAQKVNPDTGGMPWEVGYKDDYATTVIISVFDDAAGQASENNSTALYNNQNLAGYPSLQIYLRDCFPATILSSPLAWGARGDYMKIGCTLSYFSWFTKPAGAN